MKIVHKNGTTAEIRAQTITVGTTFTGKIGGEDGLRVLFKGYNVIIDLETGAVWSGADGAAMIVKEYRAVKATLTLG